MKRAKQWTRLIFIAAIMTTALPPVWGAPPATPDTSAPAVSSGYLENVTFEKLPGKERVNLTVSKQSGVTVENKPGSALMVRLENLFVPEGLRRPLDDPSLTNVIRVTPVQKTEGGRSWVFATIELRHKVPYSVRQEGMNVLIDFNVTSLASVASAEPAKPLPSAQPPDVRKKAPGTEMAPPPPAPVKDAAKDEGKRKKVYTGSRISLDVQDARIDGLFRLLSEQANVNIVAGEDVIKVKDDKYRTVTLNMKNVPWEQALDTILALAGLSQRRDGNVITVMTLERMKKDDADRAALQKKEEEEQLREPQITRVVPIAYNDPEELKKNIEELLKNQAPKDPKQPADAKAAAFAAASGSVTVDKHTRSLIIKATRRDMDTVLRFIERIDKPTAQISIKANIVETTKDTARNLGIQWGGAYGRYAGNQSLYVTPGGTGGSTVPPGSALSGTYNPTSGVTGMSGQGYGVNFPAAAILGTNPASLGLLFGTIGGNILDLQLSALQKDGKLKILSSPSLRTQDNQMASTEHGEEIPVVTPATSTNPATVSFKKAVLRLEITPHVIDGKNIRMTLLVRKDEADFTRQVQGNPPLFVKETKTDLVVADGETIVISGLTKQRTQEDVRGVPWFKEVPVLGWLFKGEETGETMEEVLIFITPSIIKSLITTGIQEGT